MAVRRRAAGKAATEALRRKARAHSQAAVEALAEILKTGSSEHARVAAAKELLDRAHGRPAQAVKVGGDEDAPPLKQVIRWATEVESTPDPAAEPPKP